MRAWPILALFACALSFADDTVKIDDFVYLRTLEPVCKVRQPDAENACTGLQAATREGSADQWDPENFGPHHPSNACSRGQLYQALVCAQNRTMSGAYDNAMSEYVAPLEQRLFSRIDARNPAVGKQLRDALRATVTAADGSQATLEVLTSHPFNDFNGQRGNARHWYANARQAWHQRVQAFNEACVRAGIDCHNDAYTLQQFADRQVVLGSLEGNAYHAYQALEAQNAEIVKIADHPVTIEVGPVKKAEQPKKPTRNSLRGDFPNTDYGNRTWLTRCLERGVDPSEQEIRDTPETEVCDRIRGDSLSEAFDKVSFLMASSSAEAYLELLRLEAITRAARSYRVLTGDALRARHFPGGCTPFGDTIDKVAAEPPPSKPLFQDPVYLGRLQRAARRYTRLAHEVKDLRDPRKFGCDYDNRISACYINRNHLDQAPSHCDEDVKHYHTMRPERVASLIDNGFDVNSHQRCLFPNDGREDVVLEIEKRLNRIAQQFPELAAARKGSDKLYESAPAWADLMAKAPDGQIPDIAVMSATEQVHLDYMKTLSLFCNAKTETDDWEKLTNMPILTGSVLRAFPQFQDVQNCMELEHSFKSDADWRKTVQLGCLIGLIGPQGPFVGAACSGILLGTAIHDYYVAKDNVNWAAACEAAHSGQKDFDLRVCTQEEYQAAAEEFDDAAGSLVWQGLFSAVDAAVALKGLRAAAAALKPKELTEATDFMRTLHNGDEAQRFTRELEESAGKRDIASIIDDAKARRAGTAREAGAIDFHAIDDSTLDGLRSGTGRPTLELSEPLEAKASLGQGSSTIEGGGVYRAKIKGIDREVALKVYGEGPNSLMGAAQAERALAREMLQAEEVGRLGLGPKVHGLVRLPDGRLGLAMDIVKGRMLREAPELINDATREGLRNIFKILDENGYGIRGDFQVMLDDAGHPFVIDTTSLVTKANCAEYGCVTIEQELAGVDRTAASAPKPKAHAPEAPRNTASVSEAERDHYREVFKESSDSHVGVPDLASRGKDVGTSGVILVGKAGSKAKIAAISAAEVPKVVKLERVPEAAGGASIKGVKIRLTRANGEVVEGFSRDLEIPVGLKDPSARLEVELVLNDGKTVPWDISHPPEGWRVALNKSDVIKKGLPGCHSIDCWEFYRRNYPDLTKQIREREVTFTLTGGKRVDMQVVDYGTLEEGGAVRQAKQPKTMFRSHDDLKAFEDEIVSQGAEQLKNAAKTERKITMTIKVAADNGKEVELKLTAWVERDAQGEIRSVETWYVEGESFNNPDINIGERNWDREPAQPKGASP